MGRGWRGISVFEPIFYDYILCSGCVMTISWMMIYDLGVLVEFGCESRSRA